MVQLTLLKPEFVLENWQMFERPLAPAYNWKEELIPSLMESISDEKVQVWSIAKREGERRKAVGILSTSVTVNQSNGLRSLSILSASKAHPSLLIEEQIYTNCLEQLKNYAQSKNCSYIITYSTEKRVIEMMDKLGADLKTCIELEV